MGYVLVSWQKYVPILRMSRTKTQEKMDDDHKIEVAKVEEESAQKESNSARKAVKAKKKEKARTVLAFDEEIGNLLRGIVNWCDSICSTNSFYKL